MRIVFAAGVFIAAAVYTAPAYAQTSGDVIFNATLADTCVVTISTPGTLAANAEVNQLSSELSGGVRGAALLVTTSLNFNVTVDTPTAFSLAPAGGETNVTFDALYSAGGVTTLTDIDDGVTSALGLGNTTLTVGASADKSTGVFPAGTYQLPVTVRCISS